MRIIIDVNGLINFYKDNNNPDWGDYASPCIADSFCKLMASECSFTGPTGSIINWGHTSEYVFKILVLDSEIVESVEVENQVDDCKVIMEMVQKLEGHRQPEQSDWEEIFVFDAESKLSVDADGRLLISETEPDVLKIKTQPTIHKDHNLIYSIKFRFKDQNQIYRYGKIDPFIKVRPNG